LFLTCLGDGLFGQSQFLYSLYGFHIQPSWSNAAGFNRYEGRKYNVTSGNLPRFLIGQVACANLKLGSEPVYI